MIERQLLSAATERGIVTAEQAARLAELARELGAAAGEPVDRERLRFITGFSDIFVTMGILLFVSAIYYFSVLSLGQLEAWILIGVIAWLLAEVFTRRRRQAFPSIVLLGLFAVAIFCSSNWLFASMTGIGPGFGQTASSFFVFPLPAVPVDGTYMLVFAGSAATTALAVTVHYIRFAVPITIAVGTASLAVLVLSLLGWAFPAIVSHHFSWFLLVTGLAIFALAMRFDLSDPERETRRTDVAFWLHLFAAPLIVHPLIGPMTGTDADMNTGSALGVIVVVLLMAAISLVIDRRAILVSGLVYLGYAVGTLAVGAGFEGPAIPLTLLVLGGFVLVLSAGWVPLRNALLRALPPNLVLRLPRPGE